jgi:hypothetical protein
MTSSVIISRAWSRLPKDVAPDVILSDVPGLPFASHRSFEILAAAVRGPMKLELG